LLRGGLDDAAPQRYMACRTLRLPQGAKEKQMSLHDTYKNELSMDFRNIDIVEIERQARVARSKAVAEAVRAARIWVAARLKRAPAGQTA